MNDDLPTWVWDLLSAVEDFEETHPKADECLVSALEAVPTSARHFAGGYRVGRRAEALKWDDSNNEEG